MRRFDDTVIFLFQVRQDLALDEDVLPTLLLNFVDQGRVNHHILSHFYIDENVVFFCLRKKAKNVLLSKLVTRQI